MRCLRAIAVGLLLLVSGALALAAQPPAVTPAQPPAFRSSVKLVLVNVVVRDRNGAVVRGLTADDFQLLEDGQPQQIRSFAFEEVGTVTPAAAIAPLLSITAPSTRVITAGPSSPDTATTEPAAAGTYAGHRLLVLLFDTSSMQPEDVQAAIDPAEKWVATQMTPSDLVAVATVSSTLQVLNDFTGDKTRVQLSLASLSAADGTSPAAIDASTAATDDASTTATDDATAVDPGTHELDTFNNDVRLRALNTLASQLGAVQQKKAILYFSSGMARSGADNQVELRKAVNAAVRANVAIYPVDARGLQAVVPGGSASNASRGGLGAFSGRNVSNQFDELTAQQETLQTLASDTGGTAFTDTNDFGEAFAKVVKDISTYYILGFSSTNDNQDGRFRRLTVRLRSRPGLKLEAREGYYADRDFAHTAKTDRETQLRDQLAAALPATDVPVFVTTGWFRMAADKYYVPISVAVPGSAVPPAAGTPTLDVAGAILDERGARVGQIRDTLTVPATPAGSSAERAVLYQTGVTLPPGGFTIKVVVRENTTGQMGSFETRVAVPDLKRQPLKLSSVVLSTQLQKAPPRKSASPLVRDDVEVVPNLAHIVGRDQTLYVYYEVYDPAAENGRPQVATSLLFYRGNVKVFETAVVERAVVDAPDRHATVFQLEVPPGSLRAGLYTCQINVVDQIAGRFAFPRMELYVR